MTTADPKFSFHKPLYGVSRWISAGFGSGYAQVAPGTVGSAVALLFFGLLWWFEIVSSPLHSAVLAAATTLVGLLTAHVCVAGSSEKDPSWIVIDEWAGLFVSLVGVASNSPVMALAAFGFFRFFDILKPGPVAWAERLPGALGIMADDIVAGILAGLCVQGVWSLWSSVWA